MVKLLELKDAVNVELVSWTEDNLQIVIDFLKGEDPEHFAKVSDRDIVRALVRHDYTSALEHISFTFEVTMSIASSRHLLEHRIASHTAESTRYKGYADEIEVVIPEVIANRTSLNDKYQELMDVVQSIYGEVEEKVGREWARYVLPLSKTCTYLWTVNARSLLNFLGLRLCLCASPETQLIARRVKEELLKVCPEIFTGIECRGTYYGYCPEPKGRQKAVGCDRYPNRDDIEDLRKQEK